MTANMRFFGAWLLLMVLLSPARAQMQACRDDKENLCAGLDSPDLVISCLLDNFDALSTDCQAAIEDFDIPVDGGDDSSDDISSSTSAGPSEGDGEGLQACRTDVNLFCSDAEQTEVLACLEAESDFISGACLDALVEQGFVSPEQQDSCVALARQEGICDQNNLEDFVVCVLDNMEDFDEECQDEIWDIMQDLRRSCLTDAINFCESSAITAALKQDYVELAICIIDDLDAVSQTCADSVNNAFGFVFNVPVDFDYCRDDMLRLCPDASESSTAEVGLGCLFDRIDDLSTECRKTVETAPLFNGNCTVDMLDFCYWRIDEGISVVIKCLDEHFDDVSSECQVALEEFTLLDCVDEAVELCPEVELQDYVNCLTDGSEENILSSECSSAVESYIIETTDPDAVTIDTAENDSIELQEAQAQKDRLHWIIYAMLGLLVGVVITVLFLHCRRKLSGGPITSLELHTMKMGGNAYAQQVNHNHLEDDNVLMANIVRPNSVSVSTMEDSVTVHMEDPPSYNSA